MSPQPCRMANRAKNATQHPGHVQRKPCQPVGPDAKSKKVDAAAAKAAKAAARRLGAEWIAEFEQDAMEKEDILDVTPHPIFTPTAGCTLIPTSDPSAATSVLESEVDTDVIKGLTILVLPQMTTWRVISLLSPPHPLRERMPKWPAPNISLWQLLV